MIIIPKLVLPCGTSEVAEAAFVIWRRTRSNSFVKKNISIRNHITDKNESLIITSVTSNYYMGF